MKVLLLVISLLLCSCTEQQRAKEWGGIVTISLPEGKRLVNATWKDSHLWYLTEERNQDQKPRTLEFIESSTWGLMNGKVIFIER